MRTGSLVGWDMAAAADTADTENVEEKRRKGEKDAKVIYDDDGQQRIITRGSGLGGVLRQCLCVCPVESRFQTNIPNRIHGHHLLLLLHPSAIIK